MTQFKQDLSHCCQKQPIGEQGGQEGGCSSKLGRNGGGLDQCAVEMRQVLPFWVYCEIRVRGLADR